MSNLSPAVANKFKALIEPTTLHLPNGKTIDMRTMTLEEATMLHELRPMYLKKLPVKPADNSSKEADKSANS